MNTGVVKWFNNKKGYGFIVMSDGVNIFVHYSEIKKNGYKSLTKEEHVTFDIKIDKDGRFIATNVNPIKK